MVLDSNSVETTSTDVFRTVLEEESGEILAVGFTEQAAEELIKVLTEMGDPPTVRLLARESVLKWLRSDFLLASATADLIADDTLSVRTTGDLFENILLVSDESVLSLVPADERVAGLVSDDIEFVETVREHWASVWETAAEFALRTPARSVVTESLTAEFGSDVEADFQTMLGALDTARGDGDGLDEVVVSLLAAAKHEELLYDISKWGEDVGIASRATFSRVKTRLEEHGLIATEKVPIEVGRPRLRLVLGDERLREVDAGELTSVAHGVLSGAPA